MTITLVRSLAALSGAVLLGCTTGAALAATTPVERGPTRMAEAVQAQTVAVDDDASAICNKSRKRLWIEGEGWIVRRVTTCR
ncbi:hypothetical protein [Methylobacterium gnaphalii]|uniref:Lipoprotein n=1 Tax=Methylobacterium gnaphalii TaxID=1010610 RepID=A0A512JKJ4_9HYPH|nr:hypothetical protein [Methylobacterium gnaphalii]GEP10402.1 hypothetical protein MGN01_22470 [Methylobacterium gnaphalii]GJD69191.1 hypothetical protein MMMDOFMJ_2118 [Methylobacterium gnaphalii]GLS47740.1 hypothetical protein GCM10007885_05840 [Methylobacterium gnaphalii]